MEVRTRNKHKHYVCKMKQSLCLPSFFSQIFFLQRDICLYQAMFGWYIFTQTLHFTQVIPNTEELKHTTHIYSILGQWQDSRSARDLLQAPQSCCRTRQSEWQTCASDRPSVGKRASICPEQRSSDHQFSSCSTQRSGIPEIEEIICNG